MAPHWDELREMDINAAQRRLIDIRDQLSALRQNPEVANHAAEEYIDEAVSDIKAALSDLERARDE